MNSYDRAIAKLPEEGKRMLLKRLLERRISSDLPTAAPDPDDQTVYPLSYGQKGLWMTCQLAPDNYAYNTPMAWKIQGKVKKAVLKQAFEALVMRHPVLRTRITIKDQEPVNSITATTDVVFSTQHIGHMCDEQIHNLIRTLVRKPFNLETGPLVRLQLLTLSETDQILLFNFHHIIFDGGSVAILIHDLIGFYADILNNQPASPPSLACTYADFVTWQREMLSSHRGQTHANYWRQKLQGELPILAMPTDNIRPPVQTLQGDVYGAEFSAELSARIRQTAQKENASVFCLLLSIYTVLLYRYTHQTDILVGTPLETRPRTEFENLIGYFVNMVVIRTILTPDLSFKELLQQVQATCLEALEHGDFPFSEIVKELAPHHDRSRSPLYQVAFAFQNWVKDFENSGLNKNDSIGITMEPMLSVHQEGDFDITLEVIETEDRYKLFFKYNPDLFHRSTIFQMAGHFSVLTEAVVADPDMAVSKLPMLTDLERMQLLIKWNDNHINFPEDKCIHHLFEEQVERTPDATAVVFLDDTLTFRELNARANQLANYLRKRGVGPRHKVGLCMERSLEMIVGLLGILKTGGAYVPLDPEYPNERLSFIVADTGMKVLLTRKQLPAEICDPSAQLLNMDTDQDAISLESSQNPDFSMANQEIAYVIYTSGSTGIPKGVSITHRSIVSHCFAVSRHYQLKADDRVLQFASLNFDASLEQILPTFNAGAALVVRDKSIWTPAEFNKIMKEMDVSVANLPPAYFHQLVQAWKASPESIQGNRLRLVIVGGDELQPKTLRIWRQTPLHAVRLLNAYGPTEATITATVFEASSSDHDSAAAAQSVPIGRPLANKSVYILDPLGNPVPVGVAGEIYIGGDGVASSYLNRQELTREKFLTDPFSDNTHARLYRTGDLARYLPDGQIEFLGRKDNQIKIRGFRIELGEIERTLLDHPEVQEAVVMAVANQADDKRILAYLVSDIHPARLADTMRVYLTNRLPAYMRPCTYVPLKALPFMPNGKVDRNALPEHGEVDFHLTEGHISPRNPIEKKLCEIWAEILGSDRVGISDDFFDRGGHSLLAVRLVGRVEKAFGVALPIASVFQAPTISEFARFFDTNKASKEFSPLVPMQPRKENTPIFCLHPGDGHVFHFSELVRQLDSHQPFYGFQAYGLEPGTEPVAGFIEMASLYIEQMQSIQQRGPYILGGFSAGGAIAFEMAQQLIGSGEDVALLFLFDSLAPHLFKPMDKTQMFMAFARDLESSANVALYSILFRKLAVHPNNHHTMDHEALNLLSSDERLQLLWECAQEAGLIKPDMDMAYMQRFYDVFHSISTGLFNYKAKPYDGRVVLFKAVDSIADHRHNVPDDMKDWMDDKASLELIENAKRHPCLGWSQYCTRPIEIMDVPGSHFTMLSHPHVSDLKHKLMQCLP